MLPTEPLSQPLHRAGTMLAEHEAHHVRDREVRSLIDGIRENSDDWPELGWAASAQGCAVDELPGHEAWRDEGAALLEAAREMLAEAGPPAGDVGAARHLRAMPGAGLAGAVGTLERTRIIDDADRFERLWRGVRGRAARDGVPELLAEGYPEAAALGETLVSAEGLDRRRRGVLDEWREIHAEQTALAEAVRTLPARVAAWEERRPPLDARGGADPADPALAAWREDGASLGLAGAAMLGPGAPHAPYIDAVPGAAKRVEGTAEAVRDALVEDRYDEFAGLARELNRRSRETGAEAYRLPRYADAIAAARILSGRARAGLSEERREEIDSWLRYDAKRARLSAKIRDAEKGPEEVEATPEDVPQRERAAAAAEEERLERERIAAESARAAEQARIAAEEEDRRRMRNRNRVAAFLERVEAAENEWLRVEFGTIASPEAERAEARRRWLEDARELQSEAEAIERDIPREELGDHLDALGETRGAIASGKTAIEFRIGIVERELAAAERAEQAGETQRPAPVQSPDPGADPAEPPAETPRETLERVRAADADGPLMALAGDVPDADREAVVERLERLHRFAPGVRLLLGDAHGFERIAADWARDKGVEHFVFRAGPEAGPDAARERDRAIVEAGPTSLRVFSDGDDPGFLARHAGERGIPVTVFPAAELLQRAGESLDPEQDTRETRDRTIRKGPSMGF